MADNKNWFQIILEFILALFRKQKYDVSKDKIIDNMKDVIEDPNLSLKDKLSKSGNDVLVGMKDVAINEAIGQSTKILSKHGKYLMGLSESQREYAIQIAYLKSVDNLGNLSFDELKEYRQIGSKALELGITATEEMNSFWNDFGDAVKAVLKVATEIGVTAGATAIKVLLL